MVDPGWSIFLIFLSVLVLPTIVVLIFFKCIRHKYHLLWIFGFLLIVISALVFGWGTQMLNDTDFWLSIQVSKSRIQLGEEAKIHLTTWLFLLSAAPVALGVNFLSKFFLDEMPPKSNSQNDNAKCRQNRVSKKSRKNRKRCCGSGIVGYAEVNGFRGGWAAQ